MQCCNRFWGSTRTIGVKEVGSRWFCGVAGKTECRVATVVQCLTNEETRGTIKCFMQTRTDDS